MIFFKGKTTSATGLLLDPNATTPEQKLDVVIEFMTEQHLDAEGGYPYDFDSDTFPKHVIVAELDGNQTRVAVWTKTYLIAWYERALEWIRSEPECDDSDFWEALNETMVAA